MFYKAVLFSCFLLISVVCRSEETSPTVLYSKESPYGLIDVIKIPGSGELCVCENKDYDHAHSTIIPGDPMDLSDAQYEKFATAAFCFADNLKNVLLLGVGGGAFLDYVTHYLSDTHVDAVDINPVMFEIIEKFRKIDMNRARFICQDAFQYIADATNYYDLIYCDIYFSTPWMAKIYKGFFGRAKAHLNEGGVFVWNAYVPNIPQAVVEDMFENFKSVTAAIKDDGLNIVFICYQGAPKTKEDLEKIANDMQAKYNFRYALPDLLKETALVSPEESRTWIAKFPVLS